VPYFIVSKSELVAVHVQLSMKAYRGGRSDVSFTCLLNQLALLVFDTICLTI